MSNIDGSTFLLIYIIYLYRIKIGKSVTGGQATCHVNLIFHNCLYYKYLKIRSTAISSQIQNLYISPFKVTLPSN